MGLTGEVRSTVDNWEIAVRRAFFDEAGDAYAFCTELTARTHVVLEAVRTSTGWQIKHLDSSNDQNLWMSLGRAA